MIAEDIILKPIVTEKSNDGLQAGKYTFKVNKKATKVEIAKAVHSSRHQCRSQPNRKRSTVCPQRKKHHSRPPAEGRTTSSLPGNNTAKETSPNFKLPVSSKRLFLDNSPSQPPLLLYRSVSSCFRGLAFGCP